MPWQAACVPASPERSPGGRTGRPPSPLRRGRHRVERALHLVSALPKVTAFSLMMGWIFLALVAPAADEQRALATRVRDDGQRVTVQSVRVLVEGHRRKLIEQQRIGGVRVLLPDTASEVPLSLTTDTYVSSEISRGWQPASAATGYAPPLDVVVLTTADGAVISVVAVDDIDGRLHRDGSPDVTRWLGALLLVVGVLGLGVWVWRFRRRDQDTQGTRVEVP